jgi:uncharacterized protein Yka (UPF0111/DUF47 family)
MSRILGEIDNLHNYVDDIIQKITTSTTQIISFPQPELKRLYSKLFNVLDEKKIEITELLDSIDVATSKLNDITKILVSYEKKIDDVKKSVNNKILDNESLDKSARKVVVEQLKGRQEDFDNLPSSVKSVIDPSRLPAYEGNGGKSKRRKQKRRYTNKHKK